MVRPPSPASLRAVSSDASAPRSVGQLPRYPQLDGLRALAVSAVLIGHFFPFDNPIRTTLPLGWLGVRLFYVISGFLITGILLEGRQVAAAGVRGLASVLRRFYVRRVLRIMPAYYGVLALALALGVEGLREALHRLCIDGRRSE